MRHKLLYTIIFLFILVGILSFFGLRYTGLIAQYIPPAEQGSIDVYFCPRENCENIIIELIDKSQNINCAFYDLDSINIISKLKEKENVKIVSDNINQLNLKDLDFVRFDDNQQLMHNKFCIFNKDGDKIVMTGSLNPTSGLNKDNLAIIKSNFLSENYQSEFDELWSNNFGKGDKVKYPKIKINDFLIENYFCPEDNCEEQLLNLIDNAKERIYFMTFSFTSNIVGDKIIEKSKNVEVKGLFEKFQSSEFNQYNKMKEANLNVKFDDKEYLLHHKVFIVDDSVLFGSYNPTKAGNERNDENIIIIHNQEIANRFLEEFNLLFGK